LLVPSCTSFDASLIAPRMLTFWHDLTIADDDDDDDDDVIIPEDTPSEDIPSGDQTIDDSDYDLGELQGVPLPSPTNQPNDIHI
jgi:hypothetical protein